MCSARLLVFAQKAAKLRVVAPCATEKGQQNCTWQQAESSTRCIRSSSAAIRNSADRRARSAPLLHSLSTSQLFFWPPVHERLLTYQNLLSGSTTPKITLYLSTYSTKAEKVYPMKVRQKISLLGALVFDSIAKVKLWVHLWYIFMWGY